MTASRSSGVVAALVAAAIAAAPPLGHGPGLVGIDRAVAIGVETVEELLHSLRSLAFCPNRGRR